MRCISSPSAVFSHERHKLDGRNATNWTGEAARDATKWTVMACTHSTTWTGKAPQPGRVEDVGVPLLTTGSHKLDG